MKSIFFSFILSAVCLSIGCSKEYELKKSIFIPDPDFPDLPAYSEWGYNTFGAFYDRELFLYSEQKVPAKIICQSGITTFVLRGQKNSYNYYYWSDGNEMSITFKLPVAAPSGYSDLTSLNKKKIDLKSEVGMVMIYMDGMTFEPQILEGILEFKRAQQLFVDKKEVEVILSGLFSFKALVNGNPVSLTEGRFDVGIGTDNFFIY